MYYNIIYFYLKIEVKHGNFTPLSEIIWSLKLDYVANFDEYRIGYFRITVSYN